MAQRVATSCLLLLFLGAVRAGVAQEQTAVTADRAIRVGSVSIHPERLPTTAPLPTLALREGVRYTQQALQLAERQITRAYAEAGYPLAVVEFAADIVGEPPVAHVGIRIEPGPRAVFGEPFVSAPAPLTPDEARRWLPFSPGDPFTASALEHGVERLESLPIAQRVAVGMAPSLVADTVVIPTFAITAHPPAGVGAAGSISSQRCVSGRVNWGHRQLFGEPRFFVLAAGGANLFARQLRNFPCAGTGDGEFSRPDYFVEAELREPLRPGTWLTLRTEVSRLSQPQAFISRGYAGRAAITRELDRRLFLTTAIAPERRDNPAGGPLFCGIYDRCSGEPLADVLARRPHTPLEATYARTAPLVEGVATPAATAPIWLLPAPAPHRFGFRFTGSGALNGLLSDATYGAVTATATAGRMMHARLEIAARFRAGAMLEGSRPPPLHARLYGGGIWGVRGVLPNRLGPLVLTVPIEDVVALGCEPVPGGCEGITVHENGIRVRPTGGNQVAELNLEARVWALRWLQLALFTDAGTLRTRAEPGAPINVRRSETVVTPGVGIMVVSPIGPFRIDIAYNPSPARSYPLVTIGDTTAEHVLLGNVRYDPYTFDAPSRTREFLRRLTLQLSPGIPF